MREIVKDDKMWILSSDPSSRLQYSQSGFWEHLLCYECDHDRIGKLDDYAARLFRGGRQSRFYRSLRPSPSELLHLETQVKYAPFKLFALSVLWRFAVSSLGGQIKLGPNQEVIRKMLLARDAGPPSRFPVGVVALPVLNGVDPVVVAGPPRGGRVGGMRHYYYFHLYGLEWTILANAKAEAIGIGGGDLLPTGRLVVRRDDATFGVPWHKELTEIALLSHAKRQRRA